MHFNCSPTARRRVAVDVMQRVKAQLVSNELVGSNDIMIHKPKQ